MTDRPWLVHYDSGVPHAIDVPSIALPELLALAAQDFPTAPAILFYGTTISYAELDTLAWRFAYALMRAGVTPGERVAVVLPNTPQAVICFYGALRAGATVVLANPLHEAGALIRQVEDAQAASIVALSMFHPLIIQARERVPFERVIYTNLKELRKDERSLLPVAKYLSFSSTPLSLA
jgi:long-chain acyl-CoA synthetase